ncbi:ABC transporter permease [Leadbettera azotonutricia]|uniref:Permease domain protein n=1 Tax=Leadbettera azotonutricia (strain ATCC BAA-888 / DSM 13862 / ZAS-9) TaxID=545695 RepID=F5YCI2_LEAAZ|nr:ABC transporter permease [Leadbettera azotonutricia]AEF80913.1 permease domain protein [Leadbettera azotonutricia ZAS-9]
MFFRMTFGALFRQRGKMLMVAFTVALGASLATAMLNVMFDVGDKVNQELKAYGANITVRPRGASLLDELYGLGEDSGAQKYLAESDLGNIKTIFWAFNIVDFTPYLNIHARLKGETVKLTGTWFNHHLELPTGETVDTGMLNMKSWWHIEGSVSGENTCLVGRIAAERQGIKVGDTITLEVGGKTASFTAGGIFNSGAEEDEYIYIPLAAAQNLAGLEGLVSSVEVSALTTPDNELSRRAAQDPKSLSIKEWDTWYCTAYSSAICYQIDEVISGAVSKPLRQVAESEGAILQKTQLLMLLITLLSLAGSALAISNLVSAGVMERSAEIGLLKAVGAEDGEVMGLVLAGVIITGIAGGIMGYFAGLGFAQIIGYSVFGQSIAIKTMVIPLVAVLITLVTLAGSIPAMRLLLSLRPAEVLHGR